MTTGELTARWIAQRESFKSSRALVDGARLVDLFLNDVAQLAHADKITTLSLEDAAVRSGYSVEHLGRLVRLGTIANAGRKGAPRIRVEDLPAKKLASSHARSYDVDTDARTLRNGRQ